MALPYHFETQTVLAQGRTTRAILDTVKSWLTTTKLPPLQEEFIILFLLSCENNTDRAIKTIENYFKIKASTPELFNDMNLNSKEIKKILKVLDLCVISPRTEQNSAVMIGKLSDTNYKNCDFISALKVAIMGLHLSQINCPPDDVIIVIDFKGVGFLHLTVIKMGPMISFLRYLQDGLPLKIRAIHIVNSNYVFDKALNLFKMFMSKEFMALIKTYPSTMNMEEFHKNCVPSSCLPKEYGGDLAPFKQLVNGYSEKYNNIQPFFNAEEELRKSYTT